MILSRNFEIRVNLRLIKRFQCKIVNLIFRFSSTLRASNHQLVDKMNSTEFTFLKAFTSEFKFRTNPVKAFSGMCVRHTSITCPVLWSSVLISVTWEWRYSGLVYKFFLINNIELKCSFVWCRKYQKSWSNGTAELHISVDLLCDTTAAELHNSVNLLCGLTTAAELHNLVDLLCDTKAAELNPVWCMHQESQTFSKDSDEPCWKIWRLNPK